MVFLHFKGVIFYLVKLTRNATTELLPNYLFSFQVTCNYFQMMNALASPAPVQFQTLAESSRNYEPGSQFAEFVRLQQANSPKAVEQVFYFEPYTVG